MNYKNPSNEKFEVIYDDKLYKENLKKISKYSSCIYESFINSQNKINSSENFIIQKQVINFEFFGIIKQKDKEEAKEENNKEKEKEKEINEDEKQNEINEDDKQNDVNERSEDKNIEKNNYIKENEVNINIYENENNENNMNKEKTIDEKKDKGNTVNFLDELKNKLDEEVEKTINNNDTGVVSFEQKNSNNSINRSSLTKNIDPNIEFED